MAALLQDKHWSWFEEEVNRHYLKFTDKKNIKLFIGTWNVNAKEPKDDITSWLIDSNKQFIADIYILGFQEIVDLNAANLWIENDANIGWENQIDSCLNNSNSSSLSYIKLASRHLVGILLCIYVRKELIDNIRNVMTSVCGVGLFGTAGNKGGVAIRFQLFDSDICFICAHLAAHKNNVQGRNQDYLKIIENLKFSDDDNNNNTDDVVVVDDDDDAININNNDDAADAAADDDDDDDDSQLLSIITSHDMIFWLGDLNYRLNYDNLDLVFDLISKKDWSQLLSLDQLNDVRNKQHAFGGFIESQINFDPTYKFQPGTSLYEQRADKKKRFPAWCDRILWRNGTKKTTNINDVECLKYFISMNQTMSDHKPVYSYLNYKCNIFNKNLRKKIRKQIMKNKDKSDNNQLPQIDIEPEVSFPLIKFGEPEKKIFIIRNTGKVHVSYRFTHADHKDSLPSWLKITPDRGLIRPNENKKIIFEICVTSYVIKLINNLNNKLCETVLLRIENTSDAVVPMKFVTVTAKYLTSCFGNKIENLIKYRKPIRYIEDINDINIMSKKHIKKQINDAHAHAHNNNDIDIVNDNNDYSTSIRTTLSIPKELWRLIDHLYKYGMDCESIFIQRGITTEISTIRECLDTGKPFTRYEIHSVGEALVRFLESLQDPVFPSSLCDSFKDNMDVTAWCRQALMRLPISHYTTFIYTISFLREVLKHSSRNKLTPEKLSYIFCSALMQSSVKDVNSLSTFKPFKILRHFLSSDLFL